MRALSSLGQTTLRDGLSAESTSASTRPNLSILETLVHDPVPGCTDGMFFQDVGPGLDVERNRLNTTGCTDHAIAAHTFQPGGAIPNPRFQDNVIENGGPNFGLEIGQFGGQRISSPMLRNNHFKMLVPGAGAISIQGTDSASISGDVIDLNGHAPGIAGIEAVDTLSPSIKGETVVNGAPNARALSIDSTSDPLITQNQFGGYIVIGNSGTFPGVTRLNGSTLFMNQIIIPVGSTNQNALFMQCNVARMRRVRPSCRDERIHRANEHGPAAAGQGLD
jgi:hypothetical protein